VRLVPLEDVGVRVPLWIPTFLRPLDLEYLDGRAWRLLAGFEYECVVLERILVIPSGFLTDFASMPRALWPLLPPTGRYGKAAVVHDFLYRTAGQATRLEADQVLVEAMTALGVSRLTRWAIYAGVRAGGRSSYHGGL